MVDIPTYRTFTKIEPVNKGMSNDKKYYIETLDKKRLLLRIAEVSEYDGKKEEFKMMQQVATLGVSMSQPVDFGICNNGKSVYTLLTWIDGKEIEEVLPTLSEPEQYALGIKAGEILHKIHTIFVSESINDWQKRYFGVIDERLDYFRTEGISFDGDTIILKYIETNKHLLKNRPQCYHHGDYHEGNMILSKDGNISIIDWNITDFDNYGDPWYEFNRISTTLPAFASGQIAGYFNGQVPQEFWKLLCYYMAVSAITSIVWAKYYSPESLNSILKLNINILHWFDNMQNPIPFWYANDFSAKRISF